MFIRLIFHFTIKFIGATKNPKALNQHQNKNIIIVSYTFHVKDIKILRLCSRGHCNIH